MAINTVSEKPRFERSKFKNDNLLLDTLRYWGFHQAAANLDIRRERVNVTEALASWKNYPSCMDEYPKVITKPKSYSDIFAEE